MDKERKHNNNQNVLTTYFFHVENSIKKCLWLLKKQNEALQHSWGSQMTELDIIRHELLPVSLCTRR